MNEPAILVLHEVGDERGGAPWRRALESADWPGAVLAPDLPGHGGQPPPVGGSYERSDPALRALATLRGGALTAAPVVMGIGQSGWAATVLALSGRATGLVLIDGLGGPWQTPEQVILASRDLLRSVAADRAAVSPPVSDGLDPRLRHGVLPQSSRRLAERAAAAIVITTLVVESPQSALTSDESQDLVGHFVAPIDTVTVDARHPQLAADVVVAWWAQGR